MTFFHLLLLLTCVCSWCRCWVRDGDQQCVVHALLQCDHQLGVVLLCSFVSRESLVEEVWLLVERRAMLRAGRCDVVVSGERDDVQLHRSSVPRCVAVLVCGDQCNGESDGHRTVLLVGDGDGVRVEWSVVVFSRLLLGKSESFEDFGTPQLYPAMALLAAWIIVGLCIIRGVKSSGKVCGRGCARSDFVDVMNSLGGVFHGYLSVSGVAGVDRLQLFTGWSSGWDQVLCHSKMGTGCQI